MKKIYSVSILASMIIVILIPNFLTAENDKKNFSEENMEFIFEQVKKIRKDGIEQGEINELVQILKEKFGGVYVNAMCRVLGIGGGILFPPFIPLSPFMIVTPIVLLDTDGLNGHWFHGVNVAIFIAFIGLPTYIPPFPLFIIAGFAGFVIGISFK